jgi:FtsZ-binding cell division protein ZapB
MVDQTPMELGDIFDYLKPKLIPNPKKPVIIKPNPEAPYGHMLEVFDLLRSIKIQQQGNAVSVTQMTMKELQEAEKNPEDLGKDVNVSIPTQREIESFWF